MSDDFKKSSPPKDIFFTIDLMEEVKLSKKHYQNRPFLTEKIEAVCLEYPDYVVHSFTPIEDHSQLKHGTRMILLHLRRDDGSLSKDVAELREKVDILVRMVSFLPDIRARIRDFSNDRYEVPDDWDDDIRNLFGSK
jgi:hypothetical protein